MWRQRAFGRAPRTQTWWFFIKDSWCVFSLRQTRYAMTTSPSPCSSPGRWASRRWPKRCWAKTMMAPTRWRWRWRAPLAINQLRLPNCINLIVSMAMSASLLTSTAAVAVAAAAVAAAATPIFNEWWAKQSQKQSTSEWREMRQQDTL